MMMPDMASPGVPRPWPLLGHVPPFVRDKLGFLDQCAQSGQPVVHLNIGGPTLLLREPGDIRYVLQEHPQSFQKSSRLSSKRGQRLSGRGVLTSSGERHRQLRDVLQPLFTRSALADFVPVIGSTVSTFIAGWTAPAARDVSIDVPLLTKCIIGRILFAADYMGDDRKLADAFLTRKKYLQYRFDFPFFWTEWLPVPLQIRYRSAKATIDKYLKTRSAQERDSPDRTCLLGRLLATGLTDPEVRDEAITLAITGYETIGDALTWALLLVAADPPAQAKVHDEAREVFSGGEPCAQHVPRLRYTSMVLSEAMRLYPPTWLFVREALQDHTLPSGCLVRAGTKIYLSPWVVHRDARFYAEPLRFRPEHFLPEEVSRRPRLAYFPLGAGPRLCLGHLLATMEGALVLALLVHAFDFSPLRNAAPRPVGRMTLSPAGPVQLRVSRR